jgi:hypothetical protein
MNPTLKQILEELDTQLAEYIDRFETITPDLEEDSDAFIADDVRELMEDIRGMINQEEDDE